ncbi:MAG: hypothetical protein FWF76_00510 [Oscillospiraceae bacterium]|nr:hypothetical protein [Oscillospiraceae bacterium]
MKTIKIRKTILIAIFLTLAISLTACDIFERDNDGGSESSESEITIGINEGTSNTEDNENSENTENNEIDLEQRFEELNQLIQTPIEDVVFEDTKSYSALNILKSETFSLRADPGFPMQMARDGDNLNVVVLATYRRLIRDGRFYTFNHGERVAVYFDATDEHYTEAIGLLEGFDTLIDLEGYTLIERGLENFRYHGELFYETFQNEDGKTKQLFFNHQDEMLGAVLEIGERERNIIYHIQSEVPDSTWELPQGFEVRAGGRLN